MERVDDAVCTADSPRLKCKSSHVPAAFFSVATIVQEETLAHSILLVSSIAPEITGEKID